MKDEVILELHIQQNIWIFLSKKDRLVALKSKSFKHLAKTEWPDVLETAETPHEV